MTQPDDLTVLPDAVFVHGGHVDRAADQIATVGQAGRAVRVDRDAYGQLCTIVPLMVNSLQDFVLDAIDAAVGSLHESADRLRTVAAGYQDTDVIAADAMRQLEGGP